MNNKSIGESRVPVYFEEPGRVAGVATGVRCLTRGRGVREEYTECEAVGPGWWVTGHWGQAERG